MIKDFDAVEYMRKQRRILSKKLLKMTKEEIVEYFKNVDILIGGERTADRGHILENNYKNIRNKMINGSSIILY